ncbi:hypothetical protein SNE40_011393 [Patella caerulea]|uniref:Uncharacterized protein n=1 Tax=Patella caerulea TaxID=87958 RepID=A0AAN8JRT7_PATCE
MVREVNRVKAKAIKNYENQYIVADQAKSNPNLFYKAVNQCTKVNKSIPILATQDGKAITDSEEAEILNSFFRYASVQENYENLPSVEIKSDKLLTDIDFTVHDVRKLL